MDGTAGQDCWTGLWGSAHDRVRVRARSRVRVSLRVRVRVSVRVTTIL